MTIIGLRELQRDLRRIDRELSKELRHVFNRAGELIVDPTQATVPKGPAARLAGTVRARSTQREGRVIMGTARRPPLVGGHRAGAERFRRGGQVLIDQFYNEAANRVAVHLEMDRGLEAVMRRAGFR